MRFLRLIAAPLFGIFFGLIVVELVLHYFPRSLLPAQFRLLDRVYSARSAWQDMMQGDPYLGYKLRPGLDINFPSEGREVPIRTSSFGLGDIGFRDIGTQPPFEAVALGDSFTLCDDVAAENCWVRHLAENTGVSFATLGVNGYSTMAAARVLDRYGRKLAPKLVVVGVFPNDFKDNVHFEGWLASGTDNYWTWMGSRRGRTGFGNWLADRSMVYRLLDGARRSRSRDIHDYKDANFDYVFRLDRWWTQAIEDIEAHRGWALMQTSLLDMRRIADEIGARFVILLFPTKEQVHWDLVRTHAPAGSNYQPDMPTEAVRRFADGNGIPWCDLTPSLRTESARGRQLYLRVSGHWNEAGNAFGAGVIESCLREKKLLPAPVASR
jgi:hypothetical protein